MWRWSRAAISPAGAANFWWMLVVALAGIVGGDYLIFAAGRRYGNELAGTRWVHRLITDEKRLRVEAYFDRHGDGIVKAARFLPGIRAVIYFVAGASHMATRRFRLFDGLAACVTVPIWLLLGRRLGRHLPQAIIWVERAHLTLLAVALLALLLAIIRDAAQSASQARTAGRLVGRASN